MYQAVARATGSAHLASHVPPARLATVRPAGRVSVESRRGHIATLVVDLVDIAPKSALSVQSMS